MKVKNLLRMATSVSVALLMLIVIAHPAISGTTGVVGGTVTDASTGEKLVGVNVLIAGTGLTTVTDKNGEYIITNVPPGAYKITTELVGYSDGVTENASVLMDVTTRADFKIDQSVAEEETSTVVEHSKPAPVQSIPIPTMYVVDSKTEQMVESQPSLLYQAPGIIATQPGVVQEPGGPLHIRGGRADEIGWTIEGIPVFDPISNGFGTNLVTVGMDKMELYTGGYRAEYGNAISGVLNEVIKTGKTAPGFSMQMLAGSDAYTGIYPEFGGTLANGGDYYVASYLWQSNLQQSIANHVDSADAVGKFNIPLGKNDTISFLGMRGTEQYLMPSFHTETYENGSLVPVSSTQDQQHQGYGLSALTYSHNINPKSFLTLRPYYFTTNVRFDGLGVNDGYGQFTSSESDTFGIQGEYTNHTSSKHLMKLGLIHMNSKNRYSAIVPYLKDYYNPVVDPETEETLYILGDYAYNANADSQQTGIYLQDQYSVTKRLSLDMGLRYDRILYEKVEHQNSSDSQVSPRIGASYASSSKDSFKTSWGKMVQFPYTQVIERQYSDPNWINVRGFDNSNIGAEKSTQFDFGWERQLTSSSSVGITPFYRWYDNLIQTRPVNPDDPYGPSIFENLGKGDSHGVEFLLKKQLNKELSGWLAYTYMVAKAGSSSDRESVTPGAKSFVDWDQRHTAALVLNYVKNSWMFSLKGEYGSGLPFGDSNELRIPSHTVFDLNISRNLEHGRIGFLIGNIFNVHNVLSGEMVPDYDGEYNIIGEHFQPTAYVLPRSVALNYSLKY